MNVCYDCNSSYETPGTCNCFAPGGKRAVGLSPWTAEPPDAVTIRWTCPACGGDACRDPSHGASLRYGVRIVPCADACPATVAGTVTAVARRLLGRDFSGGLS